MSITNHAAKRVRQRLGIPKRAVPDMVQRAYDSGIEHATARGRLKRYLDKLYLEHMNASNMRVFGMFIYLFRGQTLITVLPLPKNLRGGVPK